MERLPPTLATDRATATLGEMGAARPSAFPYPPSMDTTIETPSGPIRLQRDARHVPTLPSWWSEAMVVPASQGGPHPWALRADENAAIPGLEVHSGRWADRSAALAVLRFQRSVLPAAIAEFLGYGFGGCVLPAGFLESGDGGWTAGHLLLGRPGGVRAGAEDATREERYERAFGLGATNLFLSFTHALSEAWSASGLPPRRLGTLEIVPALRRGEVFVDFLVADGRVYHLAPTVDPSDPIWKAVAQAGLRSVSRLDS